MDINGHTVWYLNRSSWEIHDKGILMAGNIIYKYGTQYESMRLNRIQWFLMSFNGRYDQQMLLSMTLIFSQNKPSRFTVELPSPHLIPYLWIKSAYLYYLPVNQS